MKEKILKLLKNSSEHLSGEEISNMLGVSRTAVWKQINALKAAGYVIESQTRLGYRLALVPDRLYPEEIKEHLKTKFIGRNIIYLKTVDSTNVAARSIAGAGFEDGTVVVSEMQTAGKGRLGRSWHSPFGSGIWMSIIIKPTVMPTDASKVTLLTAVAVAKGLTAEVSGIKPGIKWPNDLLLKGKKVCGILTEIKADMDRIHYMIVGIGINVNDNDLPEDIRQTATSLRLETGSSFCRARVAAAVLNYWEESYQIFLRQGFASIKDEWKKHSINLGKEVRVKTLRETIQGTALDIDEEGLLLVLDAQGRTHKIVAGDVSLRI